MLGEGSALRLAIAEDRIRVIPNAVAEPFVPEGERADGEYVLAVGTLEPRKNLPRLAEAARRAGAELRVAGAPGWGDVRVSDDGVRFLGFVSDDTLWPLSRPWRSNSRSHVALRAEPSPSTAITPVATRTVAL